MKISSVQTLRGLVYITLTVALNGVWEDTDYIFSSCFDLFQDSFNGFAF